MQPAEGGIDFYGPTNNRTGVHLASTRAGPKESETTFRDDLYATFVASRLRVAKASASHVFWTTTHKRNMKLLRAFPNGQLYASAQSNERISDWNQVARGVAGRHNVTVIEVENATLPYIRELDPKKGGGHLV